MCVSHFKLRFFGILIWSWFVKELNWSQQAILTKLVTEDLQNVLSSRCPDARTSRELCQQLVLVSLLLHCRDTRNPKGILTGLLMRHDPVA
jgi:hypothetical protein